MLESSVISSEVSVISPDLDQLEEEPDPREKLFIATKFGGSLEGQFKGQASYVKSACKDSPERLQIDQIDLYYVHRKPQDAEIEETLQAMKELQDEGTIKFIGVSEFTIKDLTHHPKPTRFLLSMDLCKHRL